MRRIRKSLIIVAVMSVLIVASIILFLNRHIFDKNYHVKTGKSYVTEYSECPDKIPFVETMGAYYIVEHNGEKYVQFYDGKEYWETTCYGVDNIKTSYQNGILTVTYDWVYSDDSFPGCLINSYWQYAYFTIKVDDSIKGVYANDKYYSLFPGGYANLLDKNYEPVEHKPMHEGSESGRGRTIINDIITESGKIYHTYFDYNWADDDGYIPAQTVIADEDYNPIYTTDFNSLCWTWEGVEYAGDDTFICNTKDGIVKINANGEVIDELSGYNLLDGDIGNTRRLEKCYNAFLIYSLDEKTDSTDEYLYGLIDKDLNVCIPTECKHLSLIIQDEKEYIVAEKRLDFDSYMKDMYANYTIDGEPLSGFDYDDYDTAVTNLPSDIQAKEK